jgi:hypothetical protein
LTLRRQEECMVNFCSSLIYKRSSIILKVSDKLKIVRKRANSYLRIPVIPKCIAKEKWQLTAKNHQKASKKSSFRIVRPRILVLAKKKKSQKVPSI